MFELLAIYLSKGHSYVGRHGLGSLENEIVPVDSVQCIAGRGLVGDRFFDHKPDFKGQITFFEEEVYQAMLERFNDCSAPRSAVRRNIITKGVDLNSLIGKTFEVQGISFSGSEECRPCYWMDEAIGVGAFEWLKGRGGLRARILDDGTLRKTSVA